MKTLTAFGTKESAKKYLEETKPKYTHYNYKPKYKKSSKNKINK